MKNTVATPSAAAPTAVAAPLYEYCSTQVNMPTEFANELRAWAYANLGENDLLPGALLDAANEKKVHGIERLPHITVKYGLQVKDDSATADFLRNALADCPPVGVMLGPMNVFQGNPDYDVLYLSVASPDLLTLNRYISQWVPCVDTHPTYIPHVTVAYVRKGAALRFVGDQTFAARYFVFPYLFLSDRGGKLNTIPLQGRSWPDYPEEEVIPAVLAHRDFSPNPCRPLQPYPNPIPPDMPPLDSEPEAIRKGLMSVLFGDSVLEPIRKAVRNLKGQIHYESYGKKRRRVPGPRAEEKRPKQKNRASEEKPKPKREMPLLYVKPRGSNGKERRKDTGDVPLWEEVAEQYAVQVSPGTLLRNPEPGRLRHLFQKRMQGKVFSDPRGQRVTFDERALHFLFDVKEDLRGKDSFGLSFMEARDFREDRARFFNLVIPTIERPLEIWKEKGKNEGKIAYLAAFRTKAGRQPLDMYVIVVHSPGKKQRFEMNVVTVAASHEPGKLVKTIRKNGELLWARWREGGRKTIEPTPPVRKGWGTATPGTASDGESLRKAHASGYPLDGRREFQGLNISIENRRGSYREDKAHDPPQWRSKMYCDYGYIKMSEGADGDHIDVFVGPMADAPFAYIVNQVDPKTRKFDEQKVMLGFSSIKEAKSMYLRHYDSPEFFGSIKAMPMEEFKEKALASLHGQKIIKAMRRFNRERKSRLVVTVEGVNGLGRRIWVPHVPFAPMRANQGITCPTSSVLIRVPKVYRKKGELVKSVSLMVTPGGMAGLSGANERPTSRPVARFYVKPTSKTRTGGLA